MPRLMHPKSYLAPMKPVFPATYSTLCPEALSALLAEKYLINQLQCTLLMRGVGDTYLAAAPEARYVLRIYRSSHRTLPQIKEEVELLLHLKQAGVSVSYPIIDSTGEAIHEIDAVEGPRYAVLFSYAPGKTERTLNERQLQNLGREMAGFHHAASTFPKGNARWTFDFNTILFSPLEKLRPVFSDDQETYTWLQQMAKQVETRFSQTDTSHFSHGYCHFDFLPKNFHFDGDAVTFFDFDFMGYGWQVNDMMSFWQHLVLDVYTNRITQAAADNAYQVFLEGYRERRAVSEEELKAVPYLSIGFWLFYMGFHTTHDQFRVFTQPPHPKAYAGIIRYIVEKYWEA